MRCVHCGRCFTQDRIDKHQTICGGLKNARPKGVGGQPTQTCRKIFNAEAQRTGQGSAFLTPQKYEQHQQKKDKEVKKMIAESNAKNNWRRNHEAFQQVVKGEADSPASNTSAPSRYHDGKVECPHCFRRFAEDAAERHIPICAKVVNRAKAPPSPARSSTQGSLPSPPRDSSSVRQNINVGSSPAASSSTRAPGGAGTQAARSLRRSPSGPGGGGSSSVPPRLEAPGARATAPPGAFGRRPPLSPSPAARQRASSGTGRGPGGGGEDVGQYYSEGGDEEGFDPDVTLYPDDPHDKTILPQSPKNTRGSAVQRARQQSPGRGPRGPPPAGPGPPKIGLRRSAMLYRLLSQVPVEALQRELADCGAAQEAGELGEDREALIEAVIGELS